MTEQYPKQTHNFLAFGMDYIFFAVGLGFINLNTVLPTFAVLLGSSPAVVGTLITVLLLFWSLPQLAAGNIISRFERKKPFLVTVAFAGRPMVMLLAGLIALTRAQPPWLILLALIVAFALFLGSDGFAALAWFDILGRSFPPEKRAGYISLWQVGKAVVLLGVAAVVGFALSERGPAFPYNYALLFGLAGVCFIISAVAISRLHERPAQEGEATTTIIAWRDFARHLIALWQQDSRLRLITLARVCFSLSTMASPFYILYATDVLKISTQVIGVFILAQTVGVLVASLVLGRVADRWGAQHAIRIGVVIALTAPILALTLTAVGGSLVEVLSRAYAWVYICIGLAENLLMLGYINYVFDIAPPGQRPIYLGTFNALGAIGVLGPTIAGWVLSQTSYQMLFGTTLGMGLIALILAFRLPGARDGAPQPATGESISAKTPHT